MMKMPNDAAVAAIKFAIRNDEPDTFLRLWLEGDFDTIRQEWENVPGEVFIGADQLAATPTPPCKLTEALIDSGEMLKPGWFSAGQNGSEVSDGCDSEGFSGGCERMGHTIETCPTPVQGEGEPIYQIIMFGQSWVEVSKEAYDSTRAPFKRILYTHPANDEPVFSGRITYPANDELRKAADEAHDFLLNVQNINKLSDYLKAMIGVRDNLRKALDKK